MAAGLGFSVFFWGSEDALAKEGLQIETCSNPAHITKRPLIDAALSDMFFVFLRRDKIDVATEGFVKNCKVANRNANDAYTIMACLDWYKAAVNLSDPSQHQTARPVL